MLERSILGLTPSASERPARIDFALWPLPEPWKCARTFSASLSSSELECVFFSVTPTAVNASRIALLLTSSSLARSLIRILLIRLFVPPDCPAKPSYQPHGLFVALSNWHLAFSPSALVGKCQIPILSLPAREILRSPRP